MFQIRGFAVMAHVLRNRDVSLVSEDVLGECMEMLNATLESRALWLRGLRFLLCDRRLWCSTQWRVKLQVHPVALEPP